MGRYKRLQHLSLPIVDCQKGQNNKWVIEVRKYKRTYLIAGFDSHYDSIDKEVVDAVFSPHETFIQSHFNTWQAKGFTTAKSIWGNFGSTNTYISGMRYESIAMELAEWIEWIFRRVFTFFRSVGNNEIPNDLLLPATKPLCPSIQDVKDFSASIQDEIMARFYLIGESCPV